MKSRKIKRNKPKPKPKPKPKAKPKPKPKPKMDQESDPESETSSSGYPAMPESETSSGYPATPASETSSSGYDKPFVCYDNTPIIFGKLKGKNHSILKQKEWAGYCKWIIKQGSEFRYQGTRTYIIDNVTTF